MQRILAGALALVALALASCTTMPTIDSLLGGSNPIAPAASRTLTGQRLLGGVYSTAGGIERAYAVAYDLGVLQPGAANTIQVANIRARVRRDVVPAAERAFRVANNPDLNAALRELVAAVGDVSRLTGQPVAVDAAVSARLR